MLRGTSLPRERNAGSSAGNTPMEAGAACRNAKSFLPTRDELLRGLLPPSRRIPTALLYDPRGCALFVEITRTEEYYLTRTEMGLLWAAAPSLAPLLTGADVVELGSGSYEKMGILLDAMTAEQIRSLRYVPVDISGDSIEAASATLAASHPDLIVEGVVADFEEALDLPFTGRRRVFCFLGSTLGNLAPPERRRFFSSLAARMHPRDRLLLGVDLVKPRWIIERAYNDEAGVTAAFNLNILRSFNRLAGTDLDERAFDHVALYDPNEHRMEMYLEARRDVLVTSKEASWETLIRRGERILTEYSHKFGLRRLTLELRLAGLSVVETMTDSRGWYALLDIRAAENRG